MVCEGKTSEWLPVLSGVPQGSILGPLLYLLYTNDIVETLSAGTGIALFADDATVCREIKSNNGGILLQNDLGSLRNGIQHRN